MTRAELLLFIDDRASEYRDKAIDSVMRNSHMSEISDCLEPTQTQVDAILVDFINYCGSHQGLDYGMYTKDLVR